MSEECWNCEYNNPELDMGGGYFCVCMYPGIRESFPEVCPKDNSLFSDQEDDS